MRKPDESLAAYHERSQRDVETNWVALRPEVQASFTDHMLKVLLLALAQSKRPRANLCIQDVFELQGFGKSQIPFSTSTADVTVHWFHLMMNLSCLIAVRLPRDDFSARADGHFSRIQEREYSAYCQQRDFSFCCHGDITKLLSKTREGDSFDLSAQMSAWGSTVQIT